MYEIRKGVARMSRKSPYPLNFQPGIVGYNWLKLMAGQLSMNHLQRPCIVVTSYRTAPVYYVYSFSFKCCVTF